MRNFSFHARFCFGTVLAGFAIGLPLAFTAQAQSSNLAYEYEDGSFTAEADINPLAGRLLGRVLKKEIPSALTFSATELAGSFTIPETTTTLGNGSITLDSSPVKAFLEPYLQQAMGRVAQSYNLPEEVGIETLESVLNYSFVGQGLINSANDSTAFTFEYGDDVDSLAITGIDPAVLALCQVQKCNTQMDGDFDLKLDVEGFSETSEELGIQLPSSVKRALRRAQMFGFKEVAFADGKLTSVVQILPNLAPPETDIAPEEPEAAGSAGTGAIAPAPVTEETTTFPEAAEPATPLAPGPVPMPVQEVVPNEPVPVEPAPDQVPEQAQILKLRPIRAGASTNVHQLTQGNFILTAERLTAPWSMVFSVPSR